MSNVFTIGGDRSFTLEEANHLLPVVNRITRRTSEVADQLIDQLERMDASQSEKTLPIEEKVNNLILRWQGQIKQLGLEPRGLWMVDFKAEKGFYSWQFPEANVEHWHGRSEGFSSRRHVSEQAIDAFVEAADSASYNGTRDSI